jgi:TolB-like protein
MKKIFMSIIVASTMFSSSVFGGEKIQPIMLDASSNTASKVNQLMSILTDQLSNNKDFSSVKESVVAVTTFVKVDDLKSSSLFGNVISENLMHELQIRGFKVIDYKTMPTIKVGPKGDFIFSRSANELNKELGVNYILSGTMTEYPSGYMVNARIIDAGSRIITSTGQIFVSKQLANVVEGKPTKVINVTKEAPEVRPQHKITITDF